MHTSRRFSHLLLAFGLAFSLTACDSGGGDGDGDDGGGNGNGNGSSISLDGSAFAQAETNEAGGVVALQIVVFDESVSVGSVDGYEGDFLYLAPVSMSGLTPGTYTYGTDALAVVYGEDVVFSDVVVEGEPGTASGVFVGASGSLVISEITSSQVTGSYDFDLLAPAGGETRSVSGSFTAPLTDAGIFGSDGGNDGGGGGGVDDDGASTITASGAFSGSFTGTAVYVPGVETFDLSLSYLSSDGNSDISILFQRGDGETPAVGTYPIVPSTGTLTDDFVAGLGAFIPGYTGLVQAETGALTIDSVREREIEGSYTFTGRDASQEQSTVSGTFRAVIP